MPIIIALFLGLLPLSSFATSLTSANSHWPPWRVIETDGSLSGIDIDILKGLTARLNVDLETKGCGWNRCLKYMQVGGGDLMTGLLKTPERESYMAFIEPPYRMSNNTCFYQNKSDTNEINNYQDLSNLTVGVVKKVAYFEPFHSDQKIKKHDATTDDNLFRILKAGNIDVVIMGCVAGDVRVKSLGLSQNIKHANYVHRVEQPVYIGISKKSDFISRQAEISRALEDMLTEGEINEILSRYGIDSRDSE
ncbi:substrate-binding periplasmic protein [Psychromonas sp. KJ10-10]|uniref:substrate-binding periplasmic protein n=1 Tax=Psychromonas sp. KJ10-10 TaxID=3391823 RepID=UPI0039B6C274